MKVKHINSWKLSYWVALVESLSPFLALQICLTKEKTAFSAPIYDQNRCLGYRFAPHTMWSQGGLLIEKYGVSIFPSLDHKGWYAHAHHGRGTRMEGASPLEAAMRSIIATKYGKEVEDIAIATPTVSEIPTALSANRS